MHRLLKKPCLAFFLSWSLAGLIVTPGLAQTSSPESRRSPENQVFQFMQSGTCSAWPDSSTTKASLYLWIPETCKKLRGLLILGTNVPEQMLVGHPAIRKACARNDLGIVWAVPTFMNFRKSMTKDGQTLNMALAYKTTIDFLQELLNGLSHTSGYAEVATVPWLPMGESGHLLMVDALLEHSPERCMAGVYIKNNHLPPHNRMVPTLVAYGTAQEWGQDKVDMRRLWNNVGPAYQTIREQRNRHHNWPLSYLIDGSSGHFDCSEPLVQYLAEYINAIAKARLLQNGSTQLLPVDLPKGYLAPIPLPGNESPPIIRYSKADTTQLAAPWFPTKKLASEAQAFARINWQAQTQLPGFSDEQGQPAPYTFNGIAKLTASTYAADGITFRVKSRMLDKLPENFVGAGEPLPAVPGEPVLEWVSGPFKPLGNGTFQICLDRTWPYTANYLGVRQPGNDRIRTVFQPGGLTLPRNTTGIDQKITLRKPLDVRVGTASIRLEASSDAGLPVRFFVVAGPAIVQGDQLVFTKIPPRSQFPIAITVAAWQWGRQQEPKIKMAEIVQQTFHMYR